MNTTINAPAVPLAATAVPTSPDIIASVIPRRREHLDLTWHFLTIRVPEEWRPLSRRSATPAASPVMSATSCAAVANLLNTERLAKNQSVNSWTICIQAAHGWRFLTVDLTGQWAPASPAAIPPAAFSITDTRDRLKTIHDRLVAACEPGIHVVRVMDVRQINDWPTAAEPTTAEPQQATQPGCQCAEDVRPSFGPDPHGRSYHVALVHPLYGTLATSPARWPQEDADRILAEARPAIIVPQVGHVANYRV